MLIDTLKKVSEIDIDSYDGKYRLVALLTTNQTVLGAMLHATHEEALSQKKDTEEALSQGKWAVACNGEKFNKEMLKYIFIVPWKEGSL